MDPSQPKTKGINAPKLGSRRGSELVESALVMLPFLALVFIIIDTCYGIVLQTTLQSAAQAGANYASTDIGEPLAAGITAAVQAQFQYASVAVNYYAPSSMTTPLVGATVPNAAGNVVEVDVTYPFTPLAPLFRSKDPISLSASAAVVLAANPPPAP